MMKLAILYFLLLSPIVYTIAFFWNNRRHETDQEEELDV